MQKNEDCPSLFRTPFSLAYWRVAAQELKKPKSVILAALFMALNMTISSYFIPLGDLSLRIYFTFFVKAVGCMIYGPVVGMISGGAGDLLGYFLHPVGGFFPGYTLTSILSGLFYGVFFYRARLSVLRIFLCKLSINALINVGLGSLWNMIIYHKGYYFYLAKSVVKNAALLPFEVVLLVLFTQAMIPILLRAKLIPQDTPRRIKLI